jgi:hypothetical protein
MKIENPLGSYYKCSTQDEIFAYTSIVETCEKKTKIETSEPHFSRINKYLANKC